MCMITCLIKRLVVLYLQYLKWYSLFLNSVHAAQNPDILVCVVAVTIQFWVFTGKFI